jgi:hypothetical protein
VAVIRARPTDQGFRVGTFYMAVHGDSAVDFNISCTVTANTYVPTVRVGGAFGGTVSSGGYAFFRLPIEAHHQLVIFTSTISDVGARYNSPALALYVQ